MAVDGGAGEGIKALKLAGHGPEVIHGREVDLGKNREGGRRGEWLRRGGREGGREGGRGGTKAERTHETGKRAKANFGVAARMAPNVPTSWNTQVINMPRVPGSCWSTAEREGGEKGRGGRRTVCEDAPGRRSKSC